MDFQHSERAATLRQQIDDFMDRHVFPAEHQYREQVHGGDAAARYRTPPLVQQLKERARQEGLWSAPGDRQGGKGGSPIW